MPNLYKSATIQHQGSRKSRSTTHGRDERDVDRKAIDRAEDEGLQTAAGRDSADEPPAKI
jgi:hypothetical protein